MQYRLGTFEPIECDYGVGTSEYGLFVRTEHPPAIGAALQLAIALKHPPRLIEALGRVVHVRTGTEAGMGVELLSTDEVTRTALRALSADGAAEDAA